MKDKPQVPALQPDESPSESLEAAAIAAYLEAHPDFFIEHEELLPALRIPHQRGDTISLVERQMTILRDRNIELRHRLSHLMDVARDNDRLFEKTRRLILALMDATSLEDVVIGVEDSLRQDFQVPRGRSNAPRERILLVDQQGAVGGHKSLAGNERADALAVPFVAADELAGGDARLYPGLTGGQFSIGGQARQFGAGAGAARRAVVGLARAHDEVAAVGLIVVGKQFDMVDERAVFAMNALGF